MVRVATALEPTEPSIVKRERSDVMAGLAERRFMTLEPAVERGGREAL
jgi:hypothetical protein